MITKWQRNQIVTREPASVAFMEYLDALGRSTDSKTDVGHTHDIADVTGLGDALALKADLSHTHSPVDVVGLSEAIDDRVAALLVAGANVTLTYDDLAGTLTIAASGGGGGGDEALAWVI
jgi:Phage tail repeat like